MASPSSTSLTFPHPELTPIVGEPTTTSLRLLQKELYANARAIYSTRGGGANGHLRLLISDVAYLARTNNVPFDLPVHPGNAPVYAATATGVQIAETIRLFNQEIDDHRLFERVKSELKRMIIKSLDSRFLQVLEDIDFGFADVSPVAMLTHLQTTYGQVTPDDIEINRQLLSAEWNPDDPIENIWIRIRDCQAFALSIEAISDNAAVRLTLAVFEQTGVFASAVEKWRREPLAEQTLPNFTLHFNFENKERLRKLTAQTAGYHGAHQANIVPASPATTTTTTAITAAAVAAAATAAAAAPPVIVDSLTLYYCHTHGLGKNSAHTSATCSHPGENHKTEATIAHMMGGSDRIAFGRRTPRRLNG